MSTPTVARLLGADAMATRWLHVTPDKKEDWHTVEPRDLAVMEVKFVRLDDGKVWQVVARRRIKLRNHLDSERYPPPHGRGWQHAGEGYVAQIFARPASAALLKRLKVM